VDSACESHGEASLTRHDPAGYGRARLTGRQEESGDYDAGGAFRAREDRSHGRGEEAVSGPSGTRARREEAQVIAPRDRP
jgi:hypothetical protein